jgi:hypothetical protein
MIDRTMPAAATTKVRINDSLQHRALLMSLESMKFKAGMLRSAVFALPVMFIAGQALAQGAGPFASMGGAWSGNGVIALASGNRERIRCRANYVVNEGGDNMRLDLRCASDSYRFELSGNAVSQGGNVTGNWYESTRSVGGNISGRANAGQIQATAAGQTFTALLNMRTSGNRQSVSITSPGSELSEVAITLSKK